MSTNTKVKTELTLSDRKAVFAMLLMSCNDGELSRGSFVRVGQTFNASAQTISRVWSATLSNMEAHLEEQDNLDAYALLTENKLPLSMFPEKVFNSYKIGRIG